MHSHTGTRGRGEKGVGHYIRRSWLALLGIAPGTCLLIALQTLLLWLFSYRSARTWAVVICLIIILGYAGLCAVRITRTRSWAEPKKWAIFVACATLLLTLIGNGFLAGITPVVAGLARSLVVAGTFALGFYFEKKHHYQSSAKH